MANEKPSKDVVASEPRAADPFSVMRAEMDRVFDRFHRGWPSFADVFGTAEGADIVPTLDLKVEAKYDKGLLTITAGKRPDAVTAEKRIEIRKS